LNVHSPSNNFPTQQKIYPNFHIVKQTSIKILHPTSTSYQLHSYTHPYLLHASLSLNCLCMLPSQSFFILLCWQTLHDPIMSHHQAWNSTHQQHIQNLPRTTTKNKIQYDQNNNLNSIFTKTPTFFVGCLYVIFIIVFFNKFCLGQWGNGRSKILMEEHRKLNYWLF